QKQMTTYYTGIRLAQFYGIEIKDFAHEMAILSLWLAEHQMNQVFREELDQYAQVRPILPLQQAGNIVAGNATRIDWEEVCPIDASTSSATASTGAAPEVYVFGNPPYLGTRNQAKEQKDDMKAVFRTKYKNLDYVTIWFYKGAKFIENKNAELAFVSTNSICQGVAVAITWPRILDKNIEIGFAYQSFKWTNNAKGNAGVTVIIVGLPNKSNGNKYLFSKGIAKSVDNI